jgi:hypothetical protein
MLVCYYGTPPPHCRIEVLSVVCFNPTIPLPPGLNNTLLAHERTRQMTSKPRGGTKECCGIGRLT